MPQISDNGRWILLHPSDAAGIWFTPEGTDNPAINSQGVCNDCGAFVSQLGFPKHEEWHKWLDGKVE